MKTITKGKCMLIGAVILLILFLFPQAVKAEETWQVGESAYARLNGSVLEIYGTGDMWDADASNHYVSGHGDSFPAGGKIPYISESFTEIRIGDGILCVQRGCFPWSYAYSFRDGDHICRRQSLRIHPSTDPFQYCVSGEACRILAGDREGSVFK